MQLNERIKHLPDAKHDKKQLIMKNYTLFACVLALALGTNTLAAQEVIRCSTKEHIEYMKQQDPALEKQMANYEEQIQQWIANAPKQRTNAVITIPVVVHVVYNTAAQNISDAQVQTQIDVLNKDYSRTNADTGNTPAAFKPMAANVGIQFCLAKRDPYGNPTTGIIHKSTTVAAFSSASTAIYYSSTGGDRKSTRLNSSHIQKSRMPSSA